MITSNTLFDRIPAKQNALLACEELEGLIESASTEDLAEVAKEIDRIIERMKRWKRFPRK